MAFQIGQQVLYIPSKEKGYVIAVEKVGRKGILQYTIVINNERIQASEVDVQGVYDVSDPYQRCENGLYSTRVEYVKTNTTFKIKNSNDTSISSLKASSTLFKAHQFKPLLKFINSDNKRLLIADEVGLGKTIEAGHIMLELKARGELKNVLIVCPKSLCDKWKREMISKFGISFEIIEDMPYLIQLLRSHNQNVRVIFNYEKIRLRDENEDPRPNANLLDYLDSVKDRRFSLAIFDEAHKMRNVNQTSNGARELLKYVDATVFLTATPMMTDQENLYNLLRLLDESLYDNFQIFKNHLNENKPFVRALSEIDGGVPLSVIADHLENDEIVTEYYVNDELASYDKKPVKEYFAEYPLYRRAISNMRSGNETPEMKSIVRYDLSSMSVMNNIISRTRKREVTTELSQAERNPIKRLIYLEDEEQKMYDDTIQEYWDEHCTTNWYGEEVLERSAILPFCGLRQKLSSSVFAHFNKREDLEKGLDRFAKYEDGKVNELLSVIDEVFVNGKRKIIVFVNYINTILYLKLRLQKAGYNSIVMYGDIKNRTEELYKFEHDDNFPVLIANEVASEGVDLQFCDTLVNYDLPWNPMVIEQRIGRIDRLGQESEYIHIYNFIVDGSIQENICLRLLERIGLFRNAIGDMETILDAEIEKEGKRVTISELLRKLEQDAYCGAWSDEVLKKKEEEVLQAIENERTAIKKMEEGFSNTLTNDAYFRQEIDRIINNHAYVTEFELKNYLEMLINEAISQCNLEEVSKGVYDIVQPKTDKKALINFLTSHLETTEENAQALDKLRRKTLGQQKIRITFDQEKAFKDKDLIFINIYNPIILAATQYFLSKMDEKETTFSYSIPHDNYIQKGELFFMAIFKMEIKRNIFGHEKTSNTLVPIVYDVTNDCMVNQKLAQHIWASSQSDGNLRNQREFPVTSPHVIQLMKQGIQEEVDNIRRERVSELELLHENRRITKRQEYKKWYESRIKALRSNISDHEFKLYVAQSHNDNDTIKKEERTVKRLQSQLTNMEANHREKLLSFDIDANIRAKQTLVSISQILVD